MENNLPNNKTFSQIYLSVRNRIFCTTFIVAIAVFCSGTAWGLSQDKDNPIHFDITHVSSQDFVCENVCITHSLQAPAPFRYAAVEAPLGTSFEVRFFDDEKWLDWTRVVPEDDRPDKSPSQFGSDFFVMHHARALQLRSNTSIGNMRVVTYSLPQSSRSLLLQKVRMATDDVLPPLPLIARTDWLDPSIELQNARRDQLWKSEYDPVRKIVIHHTATAVRDINGDGILNDADYREAVRGIYSYHTYSQKWGDIGYNYIIDPSGKIWEGRFGGDGVIAGHTFRSRQCTKFPANNISLNDGSMGIALLGTYSSSTLSPQARTSLVELIAEKSWEFEIDPAGSGYFIDNIYPNVLAHRDLDCTECPGDALYADVSSIVHDANDAYAKLNNDVPHKYAAEKISVSPSSVEMKKGDSIDVTAMFWNIGTTTWRGYGDSAVMIASSAIKDRLASLEALHLASVDKKDGVAALPAQPQIIQAKLAEPNVEPRRMGIFKFKLADPSDELISHQAFTLALGQRGWVPGTDVSVEVVNTGLEMAALRTEGDPTPEITDEPERKITLHFTNKGTKSWKRGDVVLAVQGNNAAKSEFADRSWKKKDGQFAFDEKEVAPGEQATFSFLVSAPHLGMFQETTQLIANGKKLSGSDHAPLTVSVKPAYEAEVVKLDYAPTALVGWKPRTTLVLKNTSTREWKKAALSALGVDGKAASPFRDKKWKNASVVQTLKTVRPGDSVTLVFNLAIPTKKGLYRHTLSLTNGAQKIYLKSDGSYVGGVDQEVRVDPVPAKKKAAKK